MSTQRSGKIVWYRASLGRGVIRAGDGSQFFFGADGASGLDLEAGVLVDFGLTKGEGPIEATALAYTEGVRTVVHEPPAGRKTKGKKKTPTAKQRQAARKKAGTKPKPKPKGALPEGTMVSHPKLGSGHVVASTRTLVSVEFLSGGRKSFKPSTLTDLSGPDVPKAPKRKRRAAAKTKPKKEESRTVRRKKDP